jgi:hypothetical protein
MISEMVVQETLLLVLLGLVGVSKASDYGVLCTGNRVGCTLSSDLSGLWAWGSFNDAIPDNGWAQLYVGTPAAADAPAGATEEGLAYAAGFLEGAVTTDRTWQMLSNFKVGALASPHVCSLTQTFTQPHTHVA